MAQIAGIGEYKHETLFMLELFKAGRLTRKKLRELLVGKKIFADYSWHTNTYNKWIMKGMGVGLIREVDSLLELTNLGRWLVESKTRSMEDRDWFIHKHTCPKCRPSSIVLYKLKADTAETNQAGTTFMDVECPRCGAYIRRHRITGKTDKTSERILSVEEFFRFYNRVEEELRERGILD
ncbi:MAG: hypothetical protein ACLFPU_01305 [Dehalococcoidia bacterium]